MGVAKSPKVVAVVYRRCQDKERLLFYLCLYLRSNKAL